METTTLELAAARQRIATAYSPDNFAAAGQRLVAMLADHFRQVTAGRGPVLNWAPPEALIARARQHLDAAQSADDVADRLAELAQDSLRRGNNLHHPRYVGHQVPASLPLAALFELVGTATNQVMAIYEMGPWATAVERAVIDAVGEELGFAAETFSGLVTSGGTLANLTALLTARNVTLADAWSAGLAARGAKPVLVAHHESHYSVLRAAGVLGLGTDQLVRVGLDGGRRMDPNRLDDVLRQLRRDGIPIVAVSAASCATPIGAFDPLVEIAEVCRRHEVWLHVDAAHGGAAAFSARHRHLVEGIAGADSVVCDAHKMMFMPALCAMVFYREREHRVAAFHQDAPYLFDPTAADLAEYDSGLANLECTKRAAALGLWAIWSTFGSQLFADLVDVTFDLAQQFHDMLQAADDFEIPYRPECNIVVFRYLPPRLRSAPAEEIDAFQWRLRRRVIESGDAYLVANRIDQRSYLRTTLINPLTTIDDLAEILEIVRRRGAEV